ncbi:MAG: rhodanese-like domain-containing protein [Acidimicrobiia bacterium]
MNPIEQIPAEEWARWAEQHDGVLLDVRQPDEWEQGTLPNAVLLPMTEIMDRIDEIPKDRAILCICRSGGRSQQVATFLAFNGYESVANLSGGMHELGMQS